MSFIYKITSHLERWLSSSAVYFLRGGGSKVNLWQRMMSEEAAEDGGGVQGLRKELGGLSG